MLDEQPIGGHVVPVDHHAGVGRVDRPPHTVAVVRAPRPDVVEDHIAAVDDERRRRRAGRRSADSEEDVGQDRRVGGVAGIVTGSDLQKHLRGARAGVEYDAGHQVAARVDEPHRRATVVRDQGREAQAQDHRVGMHDLDRLVEVIDPRGQDQVLAAGERRRDRVRRVARPRDKEVLDRYRRTGRLTAGPRRARGVVLDGGNEHLVSACRVDVQVGRLARDRARCQGRERRVGERLGRGADDAREDLVPDRVGPVVDPAVARDPLLLRAVDDDAAVEGRVSDETAACERRSGAVVHQGGETVDVDATHRGRLGDRPELTGVAAEVRGVHVDREV